MRSLKTIIYSTVKVSIVFALIITMFFPLDISAYSQWFPFTVAWDDSLENNIDISNIVLDAPAGEHGFVKIKEGHFYFEDGLRTRFWGINLTFKGCFPEKAVADKTAEHLAKYGFNLVRLHHMDTIRSPSGIISRESDDTQVIDDEQLDRMDYFIHKLKENGIYVNINLHVGREFTEEDGVVDAELLPDLSKIVTIFDDRLIELQKDYAKKLLRHYNPYTEKRYCDDPVIAMVEITNENSLFPAWQDGALLGAEGDHFKALPEYYVEELDLKWNEWLKSKYETTENLKKAWSLDDSSENYVVNSDFENPLADTWNISKYGDTVASFSQDDFDKVTGDYSIRADIENATGTEYDLQLKQLGIQLQNGKNYTLNFNAKADRELDIYVTYMQNVSPFSNYGLFEQVSVKTEWDEYSIDFTANQLYNDSRLSFDLGLSSGKLWLDSVEVVEKQMYYFEHNESLENMNIRRTEWNDRFERSDQRIADETEFYYTIEKEYFEDMLSYIDDTLCVKAPISTSNYFYGHVDLKAQSVGDFMNAHSYYDHPTFEDGIWNEDNFTIENGSLIAEAQTDKNDINFNTFIEKIALSAVLGKPLVVSEWNIAFPNDYEYEAMPLLTSYALLQGWDALCLYSYTNNLYKTPEQNGIEDFFDSMNNSIKMSQSPICSLMFLRGDLQQAKRKITLNMPLVDFVNEYKYIGESRKLKVDGGYIPSSVVYMNRINLSNDESLARVKMTDVFTKKALKKLQTETTHTSDTGEIIWDFENENKEYLKINSSKTQGAVGFLSGQTIETDNLLLNIETDSSFLATSLDEEPITTTSKILLSVVGKQKNTHAGWGGGPVLMEPVLGTVEIKVDRPEDCVVNILNSDGSVSAPKEFERNGDSIIIELGAETLWYEIIRTINVE